jgi:single-stranded DNA-binding protein
MTNVPQTVIAKGQFHLIGIMLSRLGVRSTATGRVVARFIVRSHGVEYRCVAWGREAAEVARFSEGDQLELTGRQQTRWSTDPRTGEPWETTEIVVWTVGAPSSSV